MHFTKVKLKNFRNYDEITVEFHPRVNLIIGKNAQGKTNLIESLSVMSLGKSFRTNKDNEMIGIGKDFCKVYTESILGGKPQSLEIQYGKSGKEIKIDGFKANKTSELLERAYVVTFAPEDLKIVKEEPEKRRRFMDREICQIRPVYYHNLGKYKKILNQRNTLLKKEGIDEKELEVWDIALAQCGSRIILERAAFLEKLKVYSKKLHSKITNGKENLELFYESDIPLKDNVQEQTEVFLEELKKSFKKDIFKGNTGAGPHKDDIRIDVDNKDLRHYGSQGQQRTAALSLKLAELDLIKEDKGEDAVLLLDDVLSELDVERQKFLINSLSSVQLFITATEIGDYVRESLPEGRILTIEEGTIIS